MGLSEPRGKRRTTLSGSPNIHMLFLTGLHGQGVREPACHVPKWLKGWES